MKNSKVDRWFHISLLLLFLLIFSAVSAYQFFTFQLDWHDTGHLYHIIMNVFSKGYFASYDWQTDFLNIHFTPFFYVLALLYKLLPGVEGFLFLNAAVMAVYFLVIVKFAELVSGSRAQGLLVTGLLFLNPYTWAIHLYPHFECWGFLFMLLAALGLKLRNSLLFYSTLVLGLTVKEDMWFYMLCGLFVLFERKDIKKIGFGAAICLLYYVLVLNLIYPSLYPQKQNLMRMVWSFADSPLDIVAYYATQPHAWVKLLMNEHFWNFLFPIGALLIFSPIRVLPILFSMMIWLAATEVNRSSLSYYYSSGPMALVALCLPYSLMNARNIVRLMWIRVGVSGILLVTSIYLCWFVPSSLQVSPNLRKVFSQEYHHGSSKHRKIREITNYEKYQSIMTQFSLASFVPPGKELHINFDRLEKFHKNILKPDLVIIDIHGRSIANEPPGHFNHRMNQYRQDYQLVHHQAGLYFYEKKTQL